MFTIKTKRDHRTIIKREEKFECKNCGRIGHFTVHYLNLPQKQKGKMLETRQRNTNQEININGRKISDIKKMEAQQENWPKWEWTINELCENNSCLKGYCMCLTEMESDTESEIEWHLSSTEITREQKMGLRLQEIKKKKLRKLRREYRRMEERIEKAWLYPHSKKCKCSGGMEECWILDEMRILKGIGNIMEKREEHERFKIGGWEYKNIERNFLEQINNEITR